MNDDLDAVYKQSSSITFITGRRGSGKTALSLLLMEKGREKGHWDRVAGNIRTDNDPHFESIHYFDTLQTWLETPGKKAFFLDELGKHLYKMNFMSKMAQLILEVCQLCRKYDAHLFSCAPSPKLVNRLFLGTDLLDVFMVKLSKEIVEVHNYVTFAEPYTIGDLPNTSIPFFTRDIAFFDMVNPNKPKPQAEAFILTEEDRKYLLAYAKAHTTRGAGKILGVSAMTVSNKLRNMTDRIDFTDSKA